MTEQSKHYSSKTEFFSNLGLKNLSSARVLLAGGLLGKGEDIWQNVTEHCLVQAAGCDVLAEALNLPYEIRKNLDHAAMVHDWDKKYQSKGLGNINQQVAQGEISEKEGGKVKYEFFEESEEHSIAGMREKGISEKIIKIASADGHPALPRIMSPHASLEEKILHYVGSITDESNIVPLDQRINNLERNERYKMMNEYGREVAWTDGRTLYQVQRAVGHQIEHELVDRLIQSGNLDVTWTARLKEDPKKLPEFIIAKIQDKF